MRQSAVFTLLSTRVRASGAIVYVVLATATALLILLRRPSDRLADLGVYWGAARYMTHGLPLYNFAAANADPFTYPPFAALLFWPLAHLPFVLAGILWTVGTLTAIPLLAQPLSRQLLPRTGSRSEAMWWTATGLLITAPGQSNLRFGQVSIFIVLIAALDAMGVLPERLRGVLVGLTAAVKLTPALFIIHFLLTGQWRAAARAVGALVAATLIAWVLLPQDSLDFWTRRVVSTSRIGNLAAVGNQSINGILLRTGIEASWQPAAVLILAITVTILGLLQARSLHLMGNPCAATIVVGCTTVAASPVSWVHHQFWIVLAALFLIGEGRRVGWVIYLLMTLSPAALATHLGGAHVLEFLLANARGITAALLVTPGLRWPRRVTPITPTAARAPA